MDIRQVAHQEIALADAGHTVGQGKQQVRRIGRLLWLAPLDGTEVELGDGGGGGEPQQQGP